MANETRLNMTLLLRRAEFTDSCILLAGEPGYHTSTKEFKIGDGSTTWAALPIANKTQIEAIVNAAIAAHAAGYYTKEEINAIKKALEDKDVELLGKINENAGAITAEAQAREAADTEIRTDFAAADTATLNTAKGYADTKKSEVIGTSGDTSTANTVYGAKKYAEEKAAAAQAAAEATAANDATAKANAAESAAKAHAETKASEAETTAKNYADSQDAALHTTITGEIGDAKTELEGKITSGDATTLADAKKHAEDKVAAEAELRIAADNALDGRLDTVEAKLNNVSNVMDFVGAAEALPAEGNNQSGDVIVVTAGDDAGKEFVYDDSREVGKKWVEFGSTSATDSAVADLKSRMTAAEEDIGENASAITTLGNTKLDKETYETYINGKSMSDDELKAYADGKASAAQAAAEAKAGELDTALHTVISKEIDDDVKAAIDAEVTRSNAKAKELADAAQAAAEATAEAKDAARYTTVTNDIATAKQEAIDAAEDYTDTREVEIKKYADQAEADAVATAKSYTDGREVEIKKYADQAEADAIAAAKEYTDDQDVATLTAAKAYADEKVAGAVTKVSAGNADIVVTPAGGIGDVTVAHKVYGTGTYTKPDSVSDANFVTGVTIENGHVTGASVKSLAEALSAMTFIFDGGTSAN